MREIFFINIFFPIFGAKKVSLISFSQICFCDLSQITQDTDFKTLFDRQKRDFLKIFSIFFPVFVYNCLAPATMPK